MNRERQGVQDEPEAQRGERGRRQRGTAVDEGGKREYDSESVNREREPQKRRLHRLPLVSSPAIGLYNRGGRRAAKAQRKHVGHGHRLDNLEPQELLDHLSGSTPFGRDAVFGNLIEGEAFGEQLGEASLVAEQRAVVHTRAATAEFGQRAVEPDCYPVGRANEIEVGLLYEGPATERDDRRLGLRSLGQDGMLDDAERRFTFLLEDLADGATLGRLDGGIQVDERPAELARQQSSHRGFPAAHEPEEVDQ